jgi:hypothetical protein
MIYNKKMSYTLSFVSKTDLEDGISCDFILQLLGDWEAFAMGNYGFAINGTKFTEYSFVTGLISFNILLNTLPATFTLLDGNDSLIEGSQLVYSEPPPVEPPPVDPPPVEPPVDIGPIQEESSNGSGLSDGAIIGIIFGSIILLAIIYYYSYVKYFKLR